MSLMSFLSCQGFSHCNVKYKGVLDIVQGMVLDAVHSWNQEPSTQLDMQEKSASSRFLVGFVQV